MNETNQHAVSVTGVFFVAIDRDGIIRDVNEALSARLGEARSNLIGTRWTDNCVSDIEQRTTLSYLEKLFSSPKPQALEYEGSIVTADGVVSVVDWYCAHVQHEQKGSGVVALIGADVTGRRRMTRTLMHNPNPVLCLSEDGDVVLANTVGQALLNKVAEANAECIASWKSLVHQAVSAVDSFSSKVHCEDQVYYFTGLRTQNGVDLYGMDVSDHSALKSRLEAIAQSLPGAIWEYRLYPDGSDGIEYLSPGCAELWEIDADALRGNPALLWECILPEDLPAMQRSVLDSAKTLERWQHEYRITTPSGAQKWLRGTANPKKSANGTISWLSIVTDITEIKAAQQAAEKALHDIIRVLSAAVEARDPYTAGHEHRVAGIARVIGTKLGLDIRRLEGLELAALVHDVGKIQIPAEILSKPSKLSEVEMALVRMHPEAGANLLEGIDFEWPIASIIRQHHERFDGSGYPDGLKGDETLLEARIIGVADTLEAMASHRPYRPGLGLDTAASEIRRGAGTCYDPEVAAACLSLIASGEIIL